MKLAFFSPFPPKQTGVAAYSQALVGALRKTIAVTAFDHNNPEFVAVDPDAVDFASTPEAILSLGGWDATIFSLGNNPHFHLEILRVFLRSRGILLLHDTVLYFLFAGLPAGSFYKYFCLNFGLERTGEISALAAESPEGNILRYRHPERYSFLLTPLQHAEAVIVHSHFAASVVRTLAPATPVHVLPLLALAPGTAPLRTKRADELRRTLLTRKGQVLVGTFGFLGPTKRLPSICTALLLLQHEFDIHFVIVGDGPNPMPEFAGAGLENRVTWLRYVPDEDFDAWIEATDIVLNLRYPSMGESSATLSRAMGMGKACVVTDHATFAEYPDATVWKTPHGEREIDALVEAIATLSLEKEKRKQIGAAARQYVENEQAPNQVAMRLIEIVAETQRVRAQSTITAIRPDTEAASRMRSYLDMAVQAALPTHLRSAVGHTQQQLPQSVPL